MRRRAGVWLVLLGLVAGAAGAQEKVRVSRYVTGQGLNLQALLPGPPAAGSDAAKADVEAVRRAQTTRTAEDVAAAQRDDHDETMFAYKTVLGPGFVAAKLPLTEALSVHLRGESGVVNGAIKEAFARPRPFVTDATVHPVCDQAATMSYPSGHAMVGYLEAYALAAMVPEQSAAILKRAQAFAAHRIVCGVHYPSDVEASRTVALALFGEIWVSPAFQKELAAARVEVRAALALGK